MSFSCYSTKTVYSPLRLLSKPYIFQCHLRKQNDHTERCETKTLSDQWRSFFSLVFIVHVHSPVLIGSFHSRQRSRSWNFWKLGLIWKSLTSDPTQTQLAGYQSQEGSIGPSVVQNTPCRRKGPEWLHLYGGFLQMENDENCWNQKARETKNFCMWRTAIQR